MNNFDYFANQFSQFIMKEPIHKNDWLTIKIKNLTQNRGFG